MSDIKELIERLEEISNDEDLGPGTTEVRDALQGAATTIRDQAAEIERLRAALDVKEAALVIKSDELINVLKSVLYHYGPEGANKVTADAIAARRARQTGDADNV